MELSGAGRRKNATRETTSTLKAWLNEHRKNPYPTKGEKIMLAIITKMTLTQVSTWFANARRRLKKENKMTWAPRNKSEDEDEDEGDAARGKEESADKAHEGTETSAEDEGERGRGGAGARSLLLPRRVAELRPERRPPPHPAPRPPALQAPPPGASGAP